MNTRALFALLLTTSHNFVAGKNYSLNEETARGIAKELNEDPAMDPMCHARSGSEDTFCSFQRWEPYQLNNGKWNLKKATRYLKCFESECTAETGGCTVELGPRGKRQAKCW
ncbi:hypothetical protein O9K51_04816 [Purpureocillium lavendulum]|uniref:Uncharacterized protein n=1 Tax=Purpureocillium lavendulum TaxID=1247861 RepID=A0AB34FW65_9HYPO|nr:hypothetical protein O9K51_04816 [Purpureocillium lavendulum]